MIMFRFNKKDIKTTSLTVCEAKPITYNKSKIKLSKFGM